jgi:hypothetical protein
VYDRAEDDLDFWFQRREALLGLSGSGFDSGGAVAIWDEARSSRAHGLAVADDGGYTRLYTGRTAIAHQLALAREARIAASLRVTPPETRRLLAASFSSAAAPPLVARYFDSAARAPLVGLGLVVWYELREERRPPHLLLREWDVAIKSSAAASVRVLLRPVKTRATDVYHAALGVYDEVRRHVARTRVL